MTRSLAVFLRLGVIASAAAMLLVCVRAAHAQDDDRYGFTPIPGQSAAPQPQSQPGMQPYSQGYAPPQSAPQGYAPVPQQPMPQQAYAQQPMPQQPMPQRYGEAMSAVQPIPPRGAPPGMQAYNGTSYGTQMSYDPQSYYQDPQAQRANPDYQLGPGDKLHISVFGESDLTGDYQVDGQGMVRLPLIGTLRAAGYTSPGLEAWIASALSRGYLKNPRVNVEISTYRPFYIIGAVNKPGEYAYVDNMNALNAVALAGGFTDQAKQSAVYIRHQGSTIETPVETGENPRVMPGDVVRVKTTLFWDAMQAFGPLVGPVAIAAAAIQ